MHGQFAPIFGMLTGDYNNDGHLDVLITGNSYSTEISTGNYDAMTGLLLTGDGKGNFIPVNANATGFRADGDCKGIAELSMADNSSIVLVANNSGNMESYQYINRGIASVKMNKNDMYAIIHKKDGTEYKQEFYWGNSYLSNSSKTINYNSSFVSSVTVYDNKGNKKEIISNAK